MRLAASKGTRNLSPNTLPRPVFRCVPTRASRFGRGSDASMTLIELLVAISIAVLILGAAFAVYRTIIGGSRARETRREDRSAAASALETIMSDLARSFQPACSNAAFLLDPGDADKACPRLSFAYAKPCGTQACIFYDAFYISYFLKQNGGEWALARKRIPLDQTLNTNAVFEEETLLDDVRAWKIDVFDGAGWTNRWGPTQGLKPPSAARVALETRGANMAGETLIPAGIEIKSGGQSSR
jgi:type II secretory pathway pseudopilin PulG